jgi:hypothetical protein
MDFHCDIEWSFVLQLFYDKKGGTFHSSVYSAIQAVINRMKDGDLGKDLVSLKKRIADDIRLPRRCSFL